MVVNGFTIHKILAVVAKDYGDTMSNAIVSIYGIRTHYSLMMITGVIIEDDGSTCCYGLSGNGFFTPFDGGSRYMRKPIEFVIVIDAFNCVDNDGKGVMHILFRNPGTFQANLGDVTGMLWGVRTEVGEADLLDSPQMVVESIEEMLLAAKKNNDGEVMSSPMVDWMSAKINDLSIGWGQGGDAFNGIPE